jgi:cyclic di-GMP phosphodiesterase Gmr
MFEENEGIDHSELFAHLGTSQPCWRLNSDSDALHLSGKIGTSTVVAELTCEQAKQIRAMTGVTSSLRVSLVLFGATVIFHLVGRKIDTWAWGGSAAKYGDTVTVAAALEKGLSFAEQVVSEVNSLVIILDSAGRIKRFNRLCEEKTGILEVDVVGRDAIELFVCNSAKEDLRIGVDFFFQQGRTFETTRPINTKDGVRTIRWRHTIIESGSGVVEKYLVCSGTDITEELAAQARLLDLANKDALTGLPNRHAIQEIISVAISAIDEPFGLIFLDLDNFKKVNDHYGHITGDALICEVAKALSSCLSPGDKLARLGGDEFLVLVAKPMQYQVEAVAHKMLERMKLPFKLQRAEVHSGCSLGISLFPQHGSNWESLVRSADTAMYVAKEEGKSTFRVFSPEMDNKVSEYMWLDANMRRALTENQFELYYQPKISLLTGAVDGVEALIRWNHPDKGIISPASFIPYAEESGLIVPLGRWIMTAAAKQAGEWKKKGMKIRIAINVSARQLRLPTIIEDFTAALLQNNLTPSMIDIELTESCLVEDEKLAHRLIRMFRELGAQVHLDDFGTGYSSLSQLARLPMDVL